MDSLISQIVNHLQSQVQQQTQAQQTQAQQTQAQQTQVAPDLKDLIKQLSIVQQEAQQPIVQYIPPQQYASQKQMEENAKDWTYEHIRTLIYWMNIANINVFLLDASIQYYKKIVMQVMAFTFLFSSLSTTISLSQLGIDEKNNPNLSSAIKYTFVVASTISTILVGYVKLFKLQEMMDANIEMHKDWLEFATKISGELQMPKHLRTPALKLLQDMKDSYIGLFCKRPYIPAYIKRYANNYFMRYTQSNKDEERSYWCCTRNNYIKRTNIFFVFQDIMKNEIKRLAGEIELGNSPVTNPYEQTLIDGPLAVGSHLGAPKLPTSADIRPNIMIRYIYDGPFISIEVVDKKALEDQAAAEARAKAIKEEEVKIKMAMFKDMVNAKVNNYTPSAAGVGIINDSDIIDIDKDVNDTYEQNDYNMHIYKRRVADKKPGLLGVARNKIKNMRGGGSDSDMDDAPVYRERAHSFQAPERALYSQMCSNAPAPTPSIAQKSSFSYNKRPINDVVKLINEEIIARNKTNNASTTAMTSPSAFKYDNLMQMQSISRRSISTDDTIDNIDKKSIDSGNSTGSSGSTDASNYHDQELHIQDVQSRQ
jgi:hypothetical protein